MKMEVVDLFINALRYAHTQGMIYEWTRSFFDDAKLEEHMVKEAIMFANREWDL